MYSCVRGHNALQLLLAKDMMAAVELGRNKRGLESLTRSTDTGNTILDNDNVTDQEVSF